MTNVRLSLPTVTAIVVIVGAGAFAAGKSASTGVPSTASVPAPVQEAPPAQAAPFNELPPGHPPTTNTANMPPGHPPIDDTAGMSAPSAPSGGDGETSLSWKIPPRWKEAPNTSSMRLATYKIGGAGGDADVSVSQAGGSIPANAQRWIGQFDAASQKNAKQTTTKVAGFDVTIVEVQGTYSGGMSGDGGANMALLGAIVATQGNPYFFKITGPASTVLAARPELDLLLASLSEKGK